MTLRRSGPPGPPGSHRFCFQPFARLPHLLLPLSRPPFSLLFQPHFTFIAAVFCNDPGLLLHHRALYLSLVTHAIYLTSPTPCVGPHAPCFSTSPGSPSLRDGSLARNNSLFPSPRSLPRRSPPFPSARPKRFAFARAFYFSTFGTSSTA